MFQKENMYYWPGHCPEDNKMVHFSEKKSNWSFGIKSVYYESGFNIQLLSNALNIHEKVGHVTVWPYNSKRPMAYFSCPSGKQNIS